MNSDSFIHSRNLYVNEQEIKLKTALPVLIEPESRLSTERPESDEHLLGVKRVSFKAPSRRFPGCQPHGWKPEKPVVDRHPMKWVLGGAWGTDELEGSSPEGVPGREASIPPFLRVLRRALSALSTWSTAAAYSDSRSTVVPELSWKPGGVLSGDIYIVF